MRGNKAQVSHTPGLLLTEKEANYLYPPSTIAALPVDVKYHHGLLYTGLVYAAVLARVPP